MTIGRNGFVRMIATLAAAALPLAAAAAPAPLGISDSGPDASLEYVFTEIEANRLERALQRTDELLHVYPNFRLAHLIKGDLLLARSKPISTFGNASAPAERVNGLRDEAIARLRAYRERPAATRHIPRYLLQMGPDQRFAVVVDTKRARLYVYANEGGKPRFVADYYISHGKAGADKRVEGDNKTPLGVYEVTSFIEQAKLPDLYGSGAFPINYPNEWDRRLGRTGHGIWLHGTPSDTYARPPLSSEGCVTLANQDFLKLSNFVQPGLTPVIISNEIEWLSLDDWQTERRNLQLAIEDWRRDWEKTADVSRYLSHYSKDFRSDTQNLAEWSEQKRKIARSRQWIKVRLDKLSMFRNPGRDDIVVVTFEQDYRSDDLSDRVRKRQYWLKEDGRWKIVYEGKA
ncbi:L,D-transpeptidase family protein [Aromatoleum petrolei]|nr:L,D-transpeptidase family protein [Aromatoleum petrolei]QTQ37879.1 L,D-transpeptidase domain-containing protein [Aromatoleum petrolei]